MLNVYILTKSTGMTHLHVVKVDYTKQAQTKQLLHLLQMYAKDPMGGNEPIDEQVLNTLPQALQKRTFMHSFLVFENEEAIAFANCIESFSTFSGKGVLNIHDFAVTPACRGKGVSQVLLSEIQKFAKQIDCTKLTLEVLEGNASAIKAYQKAGFAAYQLNPEMGKAMFWQKYLS